MDPEWRCFSYCKWWFSIAMWVYQRVQKIRHWFLLQLTLPETNVLVDPFPKLEFARWVNQLMCLSWEGFLACRHHEYLIHWFLRVNMCHLFLKSYYPIFVGKQLPYSDLPTWQYEFPFQTNFAGDRAACLRPEIARAKNRGLCSKVSWFCWIWRVLTKKPDVRNDVRNPPDPYHP